MKKFIEIDFPDDFQPPERFAGCYGCRGCPFSGTDYDGRDECCMLDGENGCPIKIYFD